MYLTGTTWGNELRERLLVRKHARIFPARITSIHPPPPPSFIASEPLCHGFSPNTVVSCSCSLFSSGWFSSALFFRNVKHKPSVMKLRILGRCTSTMNRRLTNSAWNKRKIIASMQRWMINVTMKRHQLLAGAILPLLANF